MIYMLLIYCIFINIMGFFAMKIDKTKAIKQQYRISEKTLWTIAFLFGASGLAIGMNRFRHKTKHANFKLGLPVLSIIEIGIVLYIVCTKA
ncbi:DUF1294 domain-containing protein [Niallia sp. NCCP-28]|uniref:DUF1294 domain-containing protein n=1 Tax=Niallia sp. NCCP-28 TaxID=2934712 RepID=UPI00207EC801|nr:DUF1294 domain-containing protein [Niallia sp. NCCP-28]GKU81527.1 hypothetical protein NCCP28_09230 [Niallia sp. NCCP-28]